MAFSNSFQLGNDIAYLIKSGSSGPESSHLALRLVKTVKMYIWDLGTEGVAETEHITFANIGVLSFIRANC